jgi:hypothetical protein
LHPRSSLRAFDSESQLQATQTKSIRYRSFTLILRSLRFSENRLDSSLELSFGLSNLGLSLSAGGARWRERGSRRVRRSPLYEPCDRLECRIPTPACYECFEADTATPATEMPVNRGEIRPAVWIVFRGLIDRNDGLSRQEGNALHWAPRLMCRATMRAKNKPRAIGTRRTVGNVDLPTGGFISHTLRTSCNAFDWLIHLQDYVRLCTDLQYCQVFLIVGYVITQADSFRVTLSGTDNSESSRGEPQFVESVSLMPMYSPACVE